MSTFKRTYSHITVIDEMKPSGIKSDFGSVNATCHHQHSHAHDSPGKIAQSVIF